MSTETQRVDVLAVIDYLVNVAEKRVGVHQAGYQEGHSAREAVAELIKREEVLREQRDALESAMRTIKDIASERAIDYMAARYRIRAASESALSRLTGAAS